LKRIEEASSKTGEKAWRFPLWDDYFEYLKSDAADFRNVGTRAAGAIIGGVFLSKIRGEDSMGSSRYCRPASIDRERPYIPKAGRVRA